MPRITDAALILEITPNKGTETCRFSRRYAGALLYFRDSPKLGDRKLSHSVLLHTIMHFRDNPKLGDGNSAISIFASSREILILEITPN